MPESSRIRFNPSAKKEDMTMWTFNMNRFGAGGRLAARMGGVVRGVLLVGLGCCLGLSISCSHASPSGVRRLDAALVGPCAGESGSCTNNEPARVGSPGQPADEGQSGVEPPHSKGETKAHNSEPVVVTVLEFLAGRRWDPATGASIRANVMAELCNMGTFRFVEHREIRAMLDAAGDPRITSRRRVVPDVRYIVAGGMSNPIMDYANVYPVSGARRPLGRRLTVHATLTIWVTDVATGLEIAEIEVVPKKTYDLAPSEVMEENQAHEALAAEAGRMAAVAMSKEPALAAMFKAANE